MEFQILEPRRRPKNNLTKDETQRLKLLQNYKHIVIKPADKGSAIVMMNHTDYITEATRQLSDTDFYIKTPTDLTEDHKTKISNTLNTMLRNDEIVQSVYFNLLPRNCTTPAFYFLPKIHKQNITGRPIISGNNRPTEKISTFIDEHIKQFVPLTKSYVRDTPDKKIEQFSHHGDFYLVTMDVTSLYTNIPNHEGLVAVTQTLIHENAHFRVQKRSLITLLQHVQHMNNFQFNGENFLQIGGTTMGNRVAPSQGWVIVGKNLFSPGRPAKTCFCQFLPVKTGKNERRLEKMFLPVETIIEFIIPFFTPITSLLI